MAFNPGDRVRVSQDRAAVVASFDASDAAWEEDMCAYLGATGVVLEADEVAFVLPLPLRACGAAAGRFFLAMSMRGARGAARRGLISAKTELDGGQAQ